MRKIEITDVYLARERIKEVVLRTKLDLSRSASQAAGADIYLKYENEQRTGSFKIRGAYNKLWLLKNQKSKVNGIIASSAGNHAQGVAYGAQLVGLPSLVVMPTTSPIIKIKATQSYGAEIILHGENYDEAYAHAQALAEERKLNFVHAFEDPDIIAGQGTIGLELLEDQPELDCVLVPVGGGGLISGIAKVIKHLRPQCRVIGVQAERAPYLHHKRYTKSSLTGIESGPATIADGIAVKRPSQIMYEQYGQYVDDIVLVSENEIAEAIVFLIERAKTVVEGSGAVGLAAVLNRKAPLGKRNAVVLSGGNIDLNLISKIIERGLMKRGRLSWITVVVSDRPGTLQKLTEVMAGVGANILEVTHDRLSHGLGLRETRIELLVEIGSKDHLLEIRKRISQLGLQIEID